MELLDEHEQGERVRAWLRQNGSSILGGIALGVAAIFGYQWWQGSQQRELFSAADQYFRLTEAVSANDAEGVRALAAQIRQEFPDNPHALLAALQLADVELGAGNHEAALEALETARGLAVDGATRGLVTLRMARLQIARDQHEAALQLLDAQSVDDDYAGLAAELRGDALTAMGRAEDARDAYSDALSALDVAAPNRSIIEMKLAAVGGRAPTPES